MNYENTSFISSESALAQVKQELRSYFETGAMTDFLFPTYIDDVLRKMKFFGLEPKEVVQYFENYKSVLPPDFHELRSAKLYQSEILISNPAPVMRGHYYTTFTTTDGCSEAATSVFYDEFVLPFPETSVVFKYPKMLRVYYSDRHLCSEDCPNLNSTSSDVIKIQPGNKLSASFKEGCVLIKYYSKPLDEDGIPMIPEIFEIEQYLMSYIKYKLFESLWHSTSDESQAQVRDKFIFYRQEQFDKLSAANSWLKLHTRQQVRDILVRNRTRHSKFHIN